MAAATKSLSDPVAEVPTQDAWQIAKGACEAVDLMEAGESWENAANYLRGKSSAQKYPAQAEQLLADLAKANNSFDVATVLAKVAICEAADRKA